VQTILEICFERVCLQVGVHLKQMLWNVRDATLAITTTHRLWTT